MGNIHASLKGFCLFNESISFPEIMGFVVFEVFGAIEVTSGCIKIKKLHILLVCVLNSIYRTNHGFLYQPPINLPATDFLTLYNDCRPAIYNRLFPTTFKRWFLYQHCFVTTCRILGVNSPHSQNRLHPNKFCYLSVTGNSIPGTKVKLVKYEFLDVF